MKLEKLNKMLVRTYSEWFQRTLEIPLLFKNLTLPPNTICLEIGCGNGVGSFLINNHYNCKKIIALDYDSDAISKSKNYFSDINKKLKTSKINRITSVVADAKNIPFNDEYFDVVFSFAIFHHIKDWKRGIKEVCRVLKSGGNLYVQNPLNLCCLHLLLVILIGQIQ